MSGDLHPDDSAAPVSGGDPGLPPELHPLQDDDPRAVGPYRIVGRIGAGWTSVVYGGLDDHEECVAVKVIRAEHADDPAFRSDFPHEVERLRRVGGVCTATVRAADPHADQPWIAADYVPGRNLAQHVREFGPIEGDTLSAFAAGTAEALAALHATGIAHRDVKPGNIILAPDGPKLVDLGLDTPGRPLGGSGWVFPEGYGGGPATSAADIFGWGYLVVLAATGRPPFHASSQGELRLRVLESEPDLSGLPEELLFSVQWALAKDPEDRPHASTLLRTQLAETSEGPHAENSGPHARLRGLLSRHWHGIDAASHNPQRWVTAFLYAPDVPDSAGGPEEDSGEEPAGAAGAVGTVGVITSSEPEGPNADAEATATFSRSPASTPGSGEDSEGAAAAVPAAVLQPAPPPPPYAVHPAAPAPPAPPTDAPPPPPSGPPVFVAPPPAEPAAGAPMEASANGAAIVSSANGEPMGGAANSGGPGARPSRRATLLKIGIAAALACALAGGGFLAYEAFRDNGPDSAEAAGPDREDGSAPGGGQNPDGAPGDDEAGGEDGTGSDAEAPASGDSDSSGGGGSGGSTTWPPEHGNANAADGHTVEFRARSELEPGCIEATGARIAREVVADPDPPSDCLDLPRRTGDSIQLTGGRHFPGGVVGEVAFDEFYIATPDGPIYADPAASSQSVEGITVIFELVFPGAPDQGVLTYEGTEAGSGAYPPVSVCYNINSGYSEGLDACV